nr:MAG TPA: hypothetical protein [Caudoviricetes sp.]
MLPYSLDYIFVSQRLSFRNHLILLHIGIVVERFLFDADCLKESSQQLERFYKSNSTYLPLPAYVLSKSLV